MINHATTIRVKAERRLADLVDEGQKNGQIATKDKTPGPGRGNKGVRTKDTFPPVTLDELGVDRRRLDDSLANLQLLCRACHVEKTKKDRAAIKKHRHLHASKLGGAA